MLILPTRDIYLKLAGEFAKLPVVKEQFELYSEDILGTMLWRITQHYDKGLEDVQGDPDFPDEEILDALHAHEGMTRQRIRQLLAGLCLNVMDVLHLYGLLDHSVLKVYRRCYFVGQDLVLTKI